jgi:N-acetylglucosamine kinase-like BadF-type ATPase
MLLIADSGSTKTQWIFIDQNNSQQEFFSEGLNPFFYSYEKIKSILKNIFDEDIINQIKVIHFYGAGCSNESIKKALTDLFKDFFYEAININVESDLLGSAKALCKNSQGLIGILGTGSNSCYYDGVNIISNIPSLGYILSDEGSGSYLGKILLRDVFKNIAPKEINDKFFDTYKFDKNDILNSVYKLPNPNKFLASFTTFIYENIENEYIYKIVYSGLDDFLKYQITLYDNYRKTQLNCTGSIAYYFANILREVAVRRFIVINKIVKSPITELVNYHLNEI